MPGDVFGNLKAETEKIEFNKNAAQCSATKFNQYAAKYISLFKEELKFL